MLWYRTEGSGKYFPGVNGEERMVGGGRRVEKEKRTLGTEEYERETGVEGRTVGKGYTILGVEEILGQVGGS